MNVFSIKAHHSRRLSAGGRVLPPLDLSVFFLVCLLFFANESFKTFWYGDAIETKVSLLAATVCGARDIAFLSGCGIGEISSD